MRYTLHNNILSVSVDDAFSKKTIRDFLNAFHISRKNIYELIQKREILLDDVPVKTADQMMQDRSLSVILEKQPVDWPAGKKECRVLYEDDFLYVVHKDPGIIIHNHEDPLNCLNAEAAAYQIHQRIESPVRPIHRLDKDTQGLVLYSKIPFFQPWLDSQLAEKKISRKYLAIVHGRMKPGSAFTVDEPIGKDRHVSDKYRVSKTGKDALTHFEVVEVQGSYSLVRCTLSTGRTHQIRVHLAWCGHPIVNDRLYGSPAKPFKHMGLWAYELSFHQPLTNKWFKVKDVENRDYLYFGRDCL